MKQLKFLVSLVGSDSEYQRDQALRTENSAQRLGVDLQIMYAQRDALTQSQQLLDVIQSKAANKPDAIIFEPVSETGLPHVARAAVGAGIGWGILNLRPPYLGELYKSGPVVFGVGADHVDIGRIQGTQLARLVPRGGDALLIQGPSDNNAARQRAQGLQEGKPRNINLRPLKAKWTEESAFQSVSAFLTLATSRDNNIQCIVAHNDPMALGAMRAFSERISTGQEPERWLALPFVGCDGLPESGRAWVPTRKLTATVVVPHNAPLALEIFVDALKNSKRPPEYTFTVSKSFPDIAQLKEVGRS